MHHTGHRVARSLSCGSLIIALVTVTWPAPSHAESAALSRARKLYDDLDYVSAKQAYRDALMQKGNRPSDLVDIYLHLGIVAASMGRNDEAVGHFQRMLCIDPDVALPQELAPKVMRRIAAAKKAMATTQTFKLTHTPASQLPAAGGLEVIADLTPDSLGLASGLTLRYRPLGQPAFGALHKDGTGRIVISVSATELAPGQDAEYFLQLTDSYGGVLWELGSERSPMLARGRTPAARALVESDPPPFFTQTWFFIAAGLGAAALIAGGATATAVAIVATAPAGPKFGRVSQEVAR